MYEEKSRKIDINWKSLIIKMVILLVAVFIIIWIVSIVKGSSKQQNESNLAENLQAMKSAALEYFTASRLPESVNGTKKITLQEMFDTKILMEFTDQDGNSCDLEDSYAEATKINTEDYTIKVKLVCGDESDYVINTISLTEDEQEENTDLPLEEEENNITEDNSDNNASSDTNNNSSSNNNTTSNSSGSSKSSTSNKSNTSSSKTSSLSSSSSGKKSSSSSTSTSSSSKNNTSSSSTTTSGSKNNTSSSSTTSSSTTRPSSGSSTTSTCTYGNLSYSTQYPLAYVISGKCAVSKSTLEQAKYANVVNSLGAAEYKKLVSEMASLKASTGANVYASSPKYSAVQNQSGKGYVGYQIYFVAKQKLTYTEKVIYAYYLDEKGNRRVVIDNRSSVKSTTSTSSSSSSVKPSTSTSTSSTSSSNTANTATQKYCKNVSKTYYSISYTNYKSNFKAYSYDWSIKLGNLGNVQNVKVTNVNYISSYDTAVKQYLAQNVSMVNGSTGISVTSGTMLKTYSLKSNNFTMALSTPYKSGGYWYTDATVNVKSYTGATKYAYNGSYVYFVPFSYNVEYVDLSDCVTDTVSNASRYSNYTIVK